MTIPAIVNTTIETSKRMMPNALASARLSSSLSPVRSSITPMTRARAQIAAWNAAAMVNSTVSVWPTSRGG